MSGRLHIVAYDIRQPAALRRMHKYLKARGAWHQLSVFILRLDEAGRQRLVRDIREMIDAKTDRVLIAPLRSMDGGDLIMLGQAGELPGPKVVIL